MGLSRLLSSETVQTPNFRPFNRHSESTRFVNFLNGENSYFSCKGLEAYVLQASTFDPTQEELSVWSPTLWTSIVVSFQWVVLLGYDFYLVIVVSLSTFLCSEINRWINGYKEIIIYLHVVVVSLMFNGCWINKEKEVGCYWLVCWTSFYERCNYCTSVVYLVELNKVVFLEGKFTDRQTMPNF